MWGVIRMIVVGLIVGAIAAVLYPGSQKLSWVMMTAIGVGGSFVGGFIGSFFDGKPGVEFKAGSFFMSILCAIGLIFVLLRLHLIG